MRPCTPIRAIGIQRISDRLSDSPRKRLYRIAPTCAAIERVVVVSTRRVVIEILRSHNLSRCRLTGARPPLPRWDARREHRPLSSSITTRDSCLTRPSVWRPSGDSRLPVRDTLFQPVCCFAHNWLSSSATIAGRGARAPRIHCRQSRRDHQPVQSEGVREVDSTAHGSGDRSRRPRCSWIS